MLRRCRWLPMAACLLAWGLTGSLADGAAAADPAGAEAQAPSEAETPADLDAVVSQRMAVNDVSAKSQEQIDELSAQADTATMAYRITNQRIDSLRSYNHQLDQLILSQDEEVAVLRQAIDEVELIARELTPLMIGMIEALDNFVELDVPFLPEERRQRIDDLHKLLLRADVTDAERYRRIIEAYQIENEYGRTIEVYQGELELDGKARLVEFLRVGRIAFLYQALDGTDTGVWDHREGAWKEAPESRRAVRKGIRIARKQTAPDMLRIPVPTAEAAK